MFLAKIADFVTPGSMIATRIPNGASSWARPFAQPFERPLRRDVRRLGERGDATGDRGDVDDRARATLTHLREHRLEAAHGTAQVDVHHVEVQRRRALLGDGVAADTGVVHQVVDATRRVEDLREALARPTRRRRRRVRRVRSPRRRRPPSPAACRPCRPSGPCRRPGCPVEARWIAVARPIPELAPVTTATGCCDSPVSAACPRQ